MALAAGVVCAAGLYWLWGEHINAGSGPGALKRCPEAQTRSAKPIDQGQPPRQAHGWGARA
jgi:hypothetical protein